jgi:4-aminobutyrate aminotransferase-like enzyme
VLKIKPPLCFSKRDADLLAGAIEQALVEYEAREEEKAVRTS